MFLIYGYPSPGLQSRKSLLGIPRQIHVDGCSHPGTKVCWAGVDEAILGVKHELPARLLPDAVLHGLDTSGQPREDTLHVTSHLHRDDPQLVLFIHPGEESLVLVVENASALRPVPLHTTCLQVLVSRHKEEVIIDQLLANFFIHASEGVVCASQVTLQVAKCGFHQALHLKTLLLSDTGAKAKPRDASAHPYPGALDRG